MKRDPSKPQVLIKSEDERIVMGEVYVPYDVDTHGTFASPEVIKEAAYQFLASGNVNATDVMHDEAEDLYNAPIVESFIVRGDNDPDGFIKGAWVVAAKVYDDELWSRIKKGELNGWSLDGKGYLQSGKAKVPVIRLIEGTTEASTSEDISPHAHNIEIHFDDQVRLIPTTTKSIVSLSEDDRVPAHVHDIQTTTATEEELGHAHRFNVE